MTSGTTATLFNSFGAEYTVCIISTVVDICTERVNNYRIGLHHETVIQEVEK